jgi:PAS domain S-box-containing protein
MLMNAEGDILWVNDSFTRMYEYTFQEFTAKLGNNIRKTSFNPKIMERLNHCYTQKTPITYEALNITKTGREIWTHTSLIPLLSDAKEIIGLVTIDSDIHKRIKASEELVQHILSFNQKIEKTAEQLNVMVELTNVLFERIEKSQRRIDRTDQIISYVKEISDQTKILGINASIEAHTAGQYGKGFRVIANEMVQISTVTINSLKEINDLIGSIKRSSDKLGTEKEKSEGAIELHRTLLSELKKEINEVEGVIHQLN